MIHIRTDDEALNQNARFACGIAWPLPAGDKYYFRGEAVADVAADCPACNPHPRQFGTPISELSGRPGHRGFERFAAIARSWGYD